MIYGRTTVGEIISTIYRDLNITDSDYETKFIEWSGAAIEQIGAGMSRKEKQSIIIVDDFVAPVPHLTTDIKRVWRIGSQEDIIENDDGSLSFDAEAIVDKARFPIRRHGDRIYDVAIHESLSEIDPPTVYPLVNTIDDISSNYKLNPGFMHFSFNRGLIHVSYKVIDSDEEGYPYIPDHSIVKEAIFYYIYHKLMIGGYEPPGVNENTLFEAQNMMRNKWTQLRDAAKALINYPDQDEYRKVADNWNSIAPKTYNSEYYTQGKYGNNRFEPEIKPKFD
jgi:hypothetical protein